MAEDRIESSEDGMVSTAAKRSLAYWFYEFRYGIDCGDALRSGSGSAVSHLCAQRERKNSIFGT